MDERLFTDSVAVMRLDFVGGIHFPLLGVIPKSELPLESPLVDEAASVKDVIKQIPPARGLLRRGFLNSSMVGQVSAKMSIVLLSTLIVKEDEVVGAPSHLGRCVSPLADKGEHLRLNGLIES